MAVGIHHTIGSAVLSSVACLLSHISPRYLANGTIFEEKE
jgi:hypothetical protein